jgi:hypothetical protein
MGFYWRENEANRQEVQKAAQVRGNQDLAFRTEYAARIPFQGKICCNVHEQ